MVLFSRHYRSIHHSNRFEPPFQPMFLSDSESATVADEISHSFACSSLSMLQSITSCVDVFFCFLIIIFKSFFQMRSSSGPLKLFIGNIGDNNKSDLSRVFSKYGEISTIYVDEKKNFAFVEFTSVRDGERALHDINHKTVNGSRLRVEYAKSDKVSRDARRPNSRERSPTSTLYNHLQV